MLSYASYPYAQGGVAQEPPLKARTNCGSGNMWLYQVCASYWMGLGVYILFYKANLCTTTTITTTTTTITTPTTTTTSRDCIIWAVLGGSGAVMSSLSLTPGQASSTTFPEDGQLPGSIAG